ncbi:hypothetical protein [Bradyrhizobium canariense]|uniref:Uncharacterized protein n=1 Tax=Bradyrhizobium canariense TaxID=255045 RepID=A0A1H1X932_9BRAD|nr:hypothetical protein [Bradyrhizobium canariense]SDT05722.1 hypothetical protein SAMN05444158_4212 [Bradyrhizobium canariense]
MFQKVEWVSFQAAAVVDALLFIASCFYAALRKDQIVVEALSGTAQIIAFAAFAASLSCVVASATLSLRDPPLAAWDHYRSNNRRNRMLRFPQPTSISKTQ